MQGERVAKVLSRAGLCSRRKVENLILSGRVTVNGTPITSPSRRITLTDRVHIDGIATATFPMPTRLWRYHKPRGLVVTHHDPEGRKNIFETLPTTFPRVMSIGRLDITSEGLLLLTNNGSFARHLELPVNRLVRCYRVRIHGKVDIFSLERLSQPQTLRGVTYGPIYASLDRVQGRNAWLTVSLCEGRNREIRRVMEACGWSVSRLIRIAYGPFQLGRLVERAVEEVTEKRFLNEFILHDKKISNTKIIL